MGFEDLEASQPGGAPTKATSGITLQRAIDMGEYDPSYLATFAEWHEMSRNMPMADDLRCLEDLEETAE